MSGAPDCEDFDPPQRTEWSFGLFGAEAVLLWDLAKISLYCGVLNKACLESEVPPQPLLGRGGK